MPSNNSPSQNTDTESSEYNLTTPSGNAAQDTQVTPTSTRFILPATATYAHIPIVALMLTQCAMDSIFFGTAFPGQIEKTFSIKLSPGQRDAANYACWGYVFSKLTMYIMTRTPVILSNPPCGMVKSNPKRLNEIIKKGLKNWKHQDRNSANIRLLTAAEIKGLKAVLPSEIVDTHFNSPLSEPNNNPHDSIEGASPRCEFNIVHFTMLIGILDALTPFITASIKAKKTHDFILPNDDSDFFNTLFLIFSIASLIISQTTYYNYRNPNNRIIYSLLWNHFRDGPSIFSRIRNACCCKQSKSKETSQALLDGNNNMNNYSTANSLESDEQPAHYFNTWAFKSHLLISFITASVDGLFPFFSHNKAMLQYNASPTIALVEPIGGFWLYFSTVYGNSFKGLLNPNTSSNINQKHLPQPWRCGFNIVSVYFVICCGASAAMVMNYTLMKINDYNSTIPAYNTTNNSTSPSSNTPNSAPSIVYFIFEAGLPLLSGILTMQKIWGFSVPKAHENTVKFFDNCKKRQTPTRHYPSRQGLCQRLSNRLHNFSDSISLWWNGSGDGDSETMSISEMTPITSRTLDLSA
jgi:hypothetical protein